MQKTMFRIFGILTVSAIMTASALAAEGEKGPKKGEKGERGGTPAERFAKTDTNGDGQLSLKELSDSFKARMTQAGREVDEERLKERTKAMFEKLDTDKSGGISKEEMAKGREGMRRRGRGEGREGRGPEQKRGEHAEGNHEG